MNLFAVGFFIAICAIVVLSILIFTDEPAKPNVNSQELTCLRLYHDIRELSKTPEAQTAENSYLKKQKSQVISYVENRCPDFKDLDMMYDNLRNIPNEQLENSQGELELQEKEPIESYFCLKRFKEFHEFNETESVMLKFFDEGWEDIAKKRYDMALEYEIQNCENHKDVEQWKAYYELAVEKGTINSDK